MLHVQIHMDLSAVLAMLVILEMEHTVKVMFVLLMCRRIRSCLLFKSLFGNEVCEVKR